jgi:hypothetical protein
MKKEPTHERKCTVEKAAPLSSGRFDCFQLGPVQGAGSSARINVSMRGQLTFRFAVEHMETKS